MKIKMCMWGRAAPTRDRDTDPPCRCRCGSLDRILVATHCRKYSIILCTSIFPTIASLTPVRPREPGAAGAAGTPRTRRALHIHRQESPALGRSADGSPHAISCRSRSAPAVTSLST